MMLKKRLTLNGNISSVNGSTNFVDGKYYHFYDRMLVADEDVPGLYQQLLASAKQTIAIWDPYYYKNCNGIFGDIQQDNIYIEILTICQGLDMKPDINDFANKVMKSIDKKKVPHCKVRVYAFSPSNTKMYPWKKWHDRFLIIDNARVYLVGSSMDSQVLADNGKNTSYGFGIMEVTEHDDLDLIKKSYERYRNALKDVPDGNGFNCFVHRP